jgi:cell division protein FtsB
MIDVREITSLHVDTTNRWHQAETDEGYAGFLAAVCDQHRENFRLWHQEDIARSPEVSDADLAAVKRAIDKLNQRRNDLIERLDDCLLAELAEQGVAPRADARFNTETPGSVIDRLSILALRLYHMEEQTQRTDATAEHLAKAAARLTILRQQHDDLQQGLRELFDDIFAGRKVLKVYRQFKMYNDPTLNPYLYRAQSRAANG